MARPVDLDEQEAVRVRRGQGELGAIRLETDVAEDGAADVPAGELRRVAEGVDKVAGRDGGLCRRRLHLGRSGRARRTLRLGCGGRLGCRRSRHYRSPAFTSEVDSGAPPERIDPPTAGGAY